ncbi:MAG: hypothetical protein KDA61_13400 [Planctomycetales bacterium]|nr:hypothetical protein [Planctomycetales bacterium]
MGSVQWSDGDWAIYRLQKSSSSPGPRAHDVFPSPHGDDYSYLVDKFWVVHSVLNDGRLELKTRRGKTHVVTVDDPRLRRPNWWQRWYFAKRFRAVEEAAVEDPASE